MSEPVRIQDKTGKEIAQIGLPVKGNCFVGTASIKRPADTTQYTAGDIITSGFAVNCATTDTSKTVTPSAMAGIIVGMAISGTGIAAASVVAVVGATTITLNNAATATNAASSLTFAMAQLFKINLTSQGGIANQVFEINEVVVKSSNGAATTLLSPQIAVYSSGAIMVAPVDNAPFVPTNWATCIAYAQSFISKDDFKISAVKGTVEYEVRAAEICRRGQLDANGCMWVVLTDGAGYTPASAELFALFVKGILH